MPNFDKTGPAGNGALTGQGRGNCGGNASGTGMGNGMGRGRRCCGRGMGMGMRRGGFRNGNGGMSLEEQEKFLEARLEEVRLAKKSQNDHA